MDESFGLLWQSFQGPSLDLILEFHDANQAVIPIIDHRKSIAGAWDMTDGFMVGIATYDAEGRVAQYSNDEALECNEVGNPGVNCAAPGGLPFGLNARWRSPLTGFVNMHHRWYSPRMGEFLSHDPLGYIDSYNLFGFATFDSINGYDPFGLANRGFFEKAVDFFNPIPELKKRWKNINQDQEEKDARWDKQQKSRLGLQDGTRNGGFKKGTKWDCKFQCKFEDVVYGADAVVNVVPNPKGLVKKAVKSQVKKQVKKQIKKTAKSLKKKLKKRKKKKRKPDPGAEKYPVDFSSKETVNRSGWYNSERDARNLARTKLGKNPIYLGNNKFRSRNGKWQYRAKPGDLNPKKGTPHIHLERLNPKTGLVLQNWHLR